ncbi:hypothetical protein Micbo1qcDRAFT_219393, partial [Microdochium bolleyi]
GAEDDWTGLGDARLRRKLQNRLNVRAHREYRPFAIVQQQAATTRSTTRYAVSAEQEILLQTAFQNSIATTPAPPCTLTLAAHALIDLSRMPDKPAAKQPEFVFNLPLGSDHLIVVVQFNVLRGLLPSSSDDCPSLSPASSTASSASSEDGLDDDNDDSQQPQPKHTYDHPIPPELLPTFVQQTTPHGDWIDYAPDGNMRDNLIRHEHAFNHDELLRDILGSVCSSGLGGEEGCGLIVWRDPWSPSGWEFTEGFARKWGFLIRGCTELLASTNRWRAQRGEEPLVVEL